MTAKRVNALAEMDRAAAAIEAQWAMYGGAESLRESRKAVAELIEAASEMNRLAKGPAGGVSQADKRAIVSRMDAALARVGAP